MLSSRGTSILRRFLSPSIFVLVGVCLVVYLLGSLKLKSAHTTFDFTTSGSLQATSFAAPPDNPPSTDEATNLPIVDLGYTRHRALSYNESGNYYNFSNIRYAAPPLGSLRFSLPVIPPFEQNVINDGAQGRVCPQAQPNWLQVAFKWIPDYLFGHPPNMTEAEIIAINETVTPTNVHLQRPDASEDCLFLDVFAPKDGFDAARAASGSATKGAPVLVWIHGGGFTSGSKHDAGTPAGLLWTSQQGDRTPVVIVTINYRLGAFGWLAGPSFQADGIPNAGLYDQQLALKWVETFIWLFGGDPNRVTVLGESAGGSSILHHITAYGGKLAVPFQQAILQSPSYYPQAEQAPLEAQYNDFLTVAGAKDLDDLRSKTSAELIVANSYIVSRSPYGKFTYGPAVDGSFVPALQSQLLVDGAFDKSVHVLVGQNSNEGLVFAHPRINDEESFTQRFLPSLLPVPNPQIIKHLAETLYPPIFDGSLGYRDQIQRMSLVIAEMVVLCNAYSINTAFNGKTYAYQFGAFPGIHHQDVSHTFYNYGDSNWGQLLFNTSAAVILQEWITTFAQDGVPSSPGFPNAPGFELYGDDTNLIKLDTGSVDRITDPAANERCKWWQQGPHV